ncbi:MAG: FtsX-like permease family protein [Bacteroidota bacterium]
MLKVSPPAWIDRLLEWYCADYYLEEVQGDLHEWYASVWTERTPRTANLRYFWAVVRYFSWFRLKPVHQLVPHLNPLTMKNITVLTYRHLKKDKLSGSVRIINLILGISTFMLAYVYAQYELNYDTYHQESEDIYRFGFNFDGNRWAATPMGAGQAVIDAIPEVQAMTRLMPIRQTTVAYEDLVFNEHDGFWADSTTFSVFAAEFLQGNPKTALNDPSSIVLTESMAKKYFGDEDPMGKTLTMTADANYRTGEQPIRQVTGIIKDLPAQSHLRYDYLASCYHWPEEFLRGWQNLWVYTYFRIPNPTHVSKVKESIIGIGLEIEYLLEEEIPLVDIILTPIQQIHLYTNHEKEYADNGNIYYVYILLAIGAFVLLVSSINFINLTIIRGLDRAKEVGLRKTIGATRLQLVFQFLGETLVILVFAGLISLVLVAALGPLVQQFSGLALPLSVLVNPQLLVLLAVILAVIELLSGVYPAWVLSQMNPAEGVKAGGRSMTMRRISATRQGLIVAQFSLSILLTVGSLVVYQQLSYLQGKNLGFQKDQVMTFELTGPRMESLGTFRDALRQVPGVEKVSLSTDIPGYRIQFQNQQVLNSEEEPHTTRMVWSDEHFLDTYNMELVAGENFKTPMTNGFNEVMVNEATVAAHFAGEDPLGKALMVSGDTATVVGVLRDFNFRSLHHAVEPLTIVNWPLPMYGNGSIRFHPEATDDVKAAVQALSREIYPLQPPVELEFLDDRFAQLYQAESQLKSMVWVLCLITLLLTLSGVLGVATYTARQRAKEVAIRKTLGSSIGQLLGLLSRNFIILLGVACLLGTPAAYLLTDWWLQDFAYQVSLHPVWFVAGALALGLVVLACSSGVILRTARTNPATVLKSE